MSQLILWDIDGTLADLSHRLHWIKQPKDWDVKTKGKFKKKWNHFFLGMQADSLIEPTAVVLTALLDAFYGHIKFVSGRPDNYRAITNEWIYKHFGIETDEDNLLMRPANDTRQDYIIKEEILDKLLAEGHEIICVFEDRTQVADMWKRRGIFVLNVNQTGIDY